jgi:hypothetical protein
MNYVTMTESEAKRAKIYFAEVKTAISAITLLRKMAEWNDDKLQSACNEAIGAILASAMDTLLTVEELTTSPDNPF